MYESLCPKNVWNPDSLDVRYSPKSNSAIYVVVIMSKLCGFTTPETATNTWLKEIFVSKISMKYFLYSYV